MDTGKAIIVAATALAVLGGAAVWAVQPRFSLTNIGEGASIRLDRRSGNMLGCERLRCRQIVEGDKIVRDPTELPAGFAVDQPPAK
ncbi:hypothetical protein [uncultured Sphingomonas sp.]|uniref:hypothetical protein n=1 Tax=uncultured Sphingomonas sp. TaxID=158754 RepID=UPI003749378A